MTLEITSCTLIPKTGPEPTGTERPKIEGKNLWVIKFRYNDSNSDFSGEVLHRTDIPLRYHLDTARGVVLYKLKNLNQ